MLVLIYLLRQTWNVHMDTSLRQTTDILKRCTDMWKIPQNGNVAALHYSKIIIVTYFAVLLQFAECTLYTVTLLDHEDATFVYNEPLIALWEKIPLFCYNVPISAVLYKLNTRLHCE